MSCKHIVHVLTKYGEELCKEWSEKKCKWLNECNAFKLNRVLPLSFASFIRDNQNVCLHSKPQKSICEVRKCDCKQNAYYLQLYSKSLSKTSTGVLAVHFSSQSFQQIIIIYVCHSYRYKNTLTILGISYTLSYNGQQQTQKQTRLVSSIE